MNTTTQDFSTNVAPYGAEYANVINGNYYYITRRGVVKVARRDSGWMDSLWTLRDFDDSVRLGYLLKLNAIANLPREYRE